MIHRIEESPDVELERPTWIVMIPADASSEYLQTPHCGMRALSVTTGVAVVDERPFEDGQQDAVYCVVHKTVAHRRLVDHAMLGVVDVELVVRTMTIRSVGELLVEREDVVFEVTLECHDVLTVALAATELMPGADEIPY